MIKTSITKPKITAEFVREYISYDPETGVLLRVKDTPCYRAKKGSECGRFCRGYLRTMLDGREYMNHRLAWLLSHGEWLDGQIDHIDGNKINNRLANLRVVTNAINQQNLRSPKSSNKSGYLGVSFNKQKQRWVSAINTPGKRVYIGLFSTPELAHAAYLQKKRELHVGCTI